MRSNAPKLGVYVHWPFCARVCPYCDFNVYKDRDVDAERWRAALLGDLRYWAARTEGRSLTSLYFGGGTPSLAPLSVIYGVIGACAEFWGFEDGAEITLEANPTDAEQSRFESFAAAGVNRLSLGVQSFDDAALNFLGRDHDGAEARQAVDIGLKVFPRLTFDLIYALPGQSTDAWRRALREALAIGSKHVSLYQLTIEDGTAFAKAVARGAWSPPDEARAADLFDVTEEATAEAGLPAYETSNHAAPGEESRHNLLYWTGGDYVGVGPGAHGRITGDGERRAIETHLAPQIYLDAIEASGHGAADVAALDPEARLSERLSMGLRLSAGVELSPGEWTALGFRAARIAALEDDGLLVRDGARLKATRDGRRVLNALLAALLA